MFEPEILEALSGKKAGITVIIEPFVYWKSPKSDTIRRSSVEDFKTKGKSVPQEQVSHNPQTRLDGKDMEDDSINLLYVNHPKVRSSASTARNKDVC